MSRSANRIVEFERGAGSRAQAGRCRTEHSPLRPLDGRLAPCRYAERFLETQAA